MFRDKIKRQSKLDAPIDKVLNEMSDQLIDSDEYDKLLDHLERLQKMRKEENPLIPTGDAVVGAVASILGIVMIVKFEQLNVLTSKATMLLHRSKTSM